jgi:hypothetical protein
LFQSKQIIFITSVGGGLFLQGKKRKGVGKRLNYGGFNFLSFFLLGWADGQVKRRKEG